MNQRTEFRLENGTLVCSDPFFFARRFRVGQGMTSDRKPYVVIADDSEDVACRIVVVRLARGTGTVPQAQNDGEPIGGQ
jgi:hypothetical protein